MEEKEQGFEFVDKRRVSAEEIAEEAEARATEAPEEPTQGAGAEGQEPPEEEMWEAEEQAGPEGAMPEMDVYGLLASFVGMLHGLAWQKMGFVASPSSGQIESDLPQAKVAIDTIQFLTGQLEKHFPEPEMRELRRMVMDLQMNYLRRSSSGS